MDFVHIIGVLVFSRCRCCCRSLLLLLLLLRIAFLSSAWCNSAVNK
jgi:hypothetical protein